jgi:Outer membrane lipoprotein-sorting protein
MDDSKECPVITNCSSPYLNLALSLVALAVMTGSLNSQQEHNGEVHRLSELACEGSGETKQNSQEMSFSKAESQPIVPNVETIVACMSRAAIRNRTQLHPYTVTREYELFGQKGDKSRSRVIANVSFQPPDFKNYRIAETEGSGIGETIVRLVLEREAALAKDSGSSDLSQENYNFRFLSKEVDNGQRCYVLQLLPKRPKDRNLLQGTIWVDARTYLIRRTEGEPEKNPSWWVRNLHVMFVYAEVDGMWLPISSEFTAKIRVFGLSTMLAHDLKYSYSALGGRGSDPSEKSPVSQSDDERRRVRIDWPAHRGYLSNGWTRGSEENAVPRTGVN